MRRTNEELALVGTLGALVLGGTAGFLAGWLTAPASGRKTRRRLGRRLEDGRADVVRRGQHAFNRAVDEVEHGIEAGRRRLNRRFAA